MAALLLPFKFKFLLFFSCLIVAWTSNTMLNKSSETGPLCLILDVRGNTFSFSQLSLMLAWTDHLWPLLCWGMFPVYPLHGGYVFYDRWILSFVRRFCIYWDDHMVFILQFVNVMYCIDFINIELPLHLWNKSHLIVVYDPFNWICSVWLADIWGIL